MYDARDIAKYIIIKRNIDGKKTTNLRLQKILYFVQCYYISFLDAPCFYNDIVAWPYGGTVLDVYFKYSIWSYHAIQLPDNELPDINISDIKNINYVIDRCDQYSITELVKICIEQDVYKYTYKCGQDNIMDVKLLYYFAL